MSTVAGSRAPSGKPDQVVEVLRSEIVRGLFSPGSRMPPQIELVRRFGVSGVTIQHALGQLIRDGFVYTRSRKGTFVAEAPPHLCHYGVAFHTHPSESAKWPQFWVALSHEAVRLQQTSTSQLSLFYGINGTPHAGDHDELVRLVQHHLLAGLIFTSNPYMLAGTPLLTEPDIPRVAIMPVADFSGVTAVNPEGFLERSLSELAARGGHRVCIVTTCAQQEPCSAWISKAAQYGLELRPEWIQAAPVDHPAWARNAAQLLMSPQSRQRPDCMIIADDNLVPSATAGLAAAGVRVPDEADVIAHTNFPWPTPSAVPVRRIGYDARIVLRTCIDIIDARRAGNDVPPLITVPACSEAEASKLAPVME